MWRAKDPNQTIVAYNGLYLQKEVQMEGLVRDIGALARFLEAMNFSRAAVLNLSNVSREHHLKRKTRKGYLNILEDLLLGIRLQVFSKRTAEQFIL